MFYVASCQEKAKALKAICDILRDSRLYLIWVVDNTL